MAVGELKFDDFFSYLVLYIEGEAFDFMINLKVMNEGYIRAYENIISVDDPSNVVLALACQQVKGICHMIGFENKESLDKIELVTYDSHTMLQKHPEFFQ